MVNETTNGPPIGSDGNGANTFRVGIAATEEESQDDQQKMHLSDGSKKSRMVVPVPDRCAKKSSELFRGWPWPRTRRNGFVVK